MRGTRWYNVGLTGERSVSQSEHSPQDSHSRLRHVSDLPQSVYGVTRSLGQAGCRPQYSPGGEQTPGWPGQCPGEGHSV